MLDYRHETFLALCRIKSYTKTAEALHLTQPAVTQHIKALEACYGSRLFTYADKKLSLTAQGELLYKFASTVAADRDALAQRMREKALSAPPLRFGATLSIGQYIMPEVLKGILRDSPRIPVSMAVENTQHLLSKLEQGDIQFALIEGLFDKSAYHAELFSTEPFIAVCSADSPLAARPLTFPDLMESSLIIRERGSGTREIFEHILHDHNLRLEGFGKVTEAGSMEAIKELVKEDLGITFLYEAAARQDILSGSLKRIDIQGFQSLNEFSFVFLKSSQRAEEFLAWFHAFKGYAEAEK